MGFDRRPDQLLALKLISPNTDPRPAIFRPSGWIKASKQLAGFCLSLEEFSLQSLEKKNIIENEKDRCDASGAAGHGNAPHPL